MRPRQTRNRVVIWMSAVIAPCIAAWAVCCAPVAGSAAAQPPAGAVQPVVRHPAMRTVLRGVSYWQNQSEYQVLARCKGWDKPQAIAFLIKRQRRDGSWAMDSLPDRGWYDDQCTANALRMLLEWYLETGDASVVGPAKRCIELLIATQGVEIVYEGEGGDRMSPFALSVGGLWRMAPDAAEWDEPWWSYIATSWDMNDGVSSGNANALAMAYAVFGDDRCKDSVLRCATSLLKLQALHNMGLPEHIGPRGEAMYGRPHEIPALSTRAVAHAIEVYVDAHRVSNDDRWATAAKLSADWLERHKLSDKPLSFQGQPPQIMWPLLLEFNTLRPVYGNAKGQAVYNVEEAVNPYGWWHPAPSAAIARAKAYFLEYAGQW